ncbi:unnamed protein product, partial [Closterium sp. Yama58-4]
MTARGSSLLEIALLLSFTCQCLAIRPHRTPSPKSTSLYIVRLRSALPLAAYRGGIASFPGWMDDVDDDESAGPSGLQATVETVAHEAATLAGRIPRRARLSLENPQLKAYAQMLESQQMRIASDVGVTSDSIVYKYALGNLQQLSVIKTVPLDSVPKALVPITSSISSNPLHPHSPPSPSYVHASNGFAATLSPQQVRLLQRHPAVAAVTRSRRVTPLTIDSPTFLAMRATGSLWPANGGQARAGEGMVVGVVDSGIWPEHPSFSDAGFPSSRPAGWTGKCDATSEFKCNNKVIGARGFYKGFKEDTGGPDLSKDWLSPRDSCGHGTWCAGAAAGNRDVPMAGGRASGMAPAARLAVYKVLWYAEGSFFGVSADMEAAVNQAVADGVDVLSLSLGGVDLTETYFSHMPYLAANLAGMLVAFAAGNGGAPGYDPSGYRTIENFSPFYLTVGASTIGRGGITLKAATPAGAPHSNSSTTPAATAYPAVADFSSTGPLRDPSTDTPATLPTNSILKPDIVGPGVDLYAAWPAEKVGRPGSYAQLSGTSMSTPHLAGIAALIMQKHPSWSPAQVMSAIMTTAKTTDTSGAAIDNGYGEAATPWEMGSGHVFPPKVLDPGLTYDARAAAYRNFLAGQSMKQAWKHFPGAKLTASAPRELNRPSISISRLKGTVTANRTVTNVADSSSTYTASIKPPNGVSITVSPNRFTIAPGQRVTFMVTFKVINTFESFQFGSLTWADADAQSYLAIKAQAARKAANDAEAVTNAALADYNIKLNAEAAIQKIIDDANADLNNAQTNLTAKKKQLDDAKVKAEPARQEMMKQRAARKAEQDYHDELQQQAAESDIDAAELERDLVPAQQQLDLANQLLADQILIAQEATADSTYYARRAAKLKTPEAQAEAAEAQLTRARANRIQGALARQVALAKDALESMQADLAFALKDKVDTKKAVADHVPDLNKAKKDAADAEATYTKYMNDMKTLPAVINQLTADVKVKTLNAAKVTKDNKVALGQAASARAQAETIYKNKKARSDALKAAADQAEADSAAYDKAHSVNWNNGKGQAFSRIILWAHTHAVVQYWKARREKGVLPASDAPHESQQLPAAELAGDAWWAVAGAA